MLSLVALDGTTGPDNCADENRSIGGELSEDMSNTEPELVIHAFLSKGPVQIYHIKVSHAYPGTGKMIFCSCGAEVHLCLRMSFSSNHEMGNML